MWPQRHRREREVGTDETASVREFRYQLRTAPVDAMRSVTRAGLASLPAEDRQAVLATIQTRLVSGARLTAEHVDEIARLATMGERREAGAVIRHLPADVLERLASASVRAGREEGLSQGYADWDGADPAVLESEVEEFRSGFDSERHYGIVKGRAEGGFST
ncbi:hypothetical protein ACOCJ4_06670 [Knoellia sp. CPCC 206435]|uniref:hypothetical protein n=1 Tax=Knoellia terrae TaxID=3404797 RepID=UPI003B42D2CE